MSNEEKKKLILDFINGPLKRYLTDEVSFGRFKELINQEFDTDFCYADLYPSYLFNAQIHYPDEEKAFAEDREYSEKMSLCNQYGLCESGDVPGFPCHYCPHLVLNAK